MHFLFCFFCLVNNFISTPSFILTFWYSLIEKLIKIYEKRPIKNKNAPFENQNVWNDDQNVAEQFYTCYNDTAVVKYQENYTRQGLPFKEDEVCI